MMAAEVSEIIDAVEIAMENQRSRRLENLKPPSRLVRNLNIAAIAVPFDGYVTNYCAMKTLDLRASQLNLELTPNQTETKAKYVRTRNINSLVMIQFTKQKKSI